ncbi:helix-turn-helix domain-containing protein [Hoeflea sp. TYP-13]|uniref:helix-turn-helix domain-containing protein n=1 Tax=Hoeflea sp. TYP-13 TaxID=3230023 RepID=UPI0034C67734
MSNAAQVYYGRASDGDENTKLHSTISAISTFDAPDGIERYVVLREAEFRAMHEALELAESMAAQSILEATVEPATHEIAEVARNSGNSVTAVREVRRMSLRQLAARTGLDEHYVIGIEDGSRRPTLTAISKIARVLNVTIDDLVNN